MDVKRVESIAVPTALAAAGAGVAGYTLPKTITKSGELSDEFVKFLSIMNRVNDYRTILEADKLDKVPDVLPTEEEIKALGKDNLVDKFKKLMDTKANKRNKALENFVIRNSEALDVHPAKGQSLRDAAKEYVKGKSVEEIKEAFLPSSIRRALENTDYEKLFRETFDEVYDKTAKKFKSGEGIDETAKMFKNMGKKMKFSVGGVWALAAGSIALLSSVIATKITNK